ncbi:chaplin family protein [Streptomyces sp. NPDC008001]|uniref:chaplin family protein n=1 Tax=Streptomyces sp. NPDC008001 TaxID=3364804 RepID=UPI0036EBAC65
MRAGILALAPGAGMRLNGVEWTVEGIEAQAGAASPSASHQETKLAAAIRSLALAGVMTAVAVMLNASPAAAGGIVVIGSPSSDDTCANQRTGARGATTSSPAHASGDVLQLPATTPLNHCGGADLPGFRDGAGVVFPDDGLGEHWYSGNAKPVIMVRPMLARTGGLAYSTVASSREVHGQAVGHSWPPSAGCVVLAEHIGHEVVGQADLAVLNIEAVAQRPLLY